jgi:hypothetical protein
LEDFHFQRTSPQPPPQAAHLLGMINSKTTKGALTKGLETGVIQLGCPAL